MVALLIKHTDPNTIDGLRKKLRARDVDTDDIVRIILEKPSLDENDRKWLTSNLSKETPRKEMREQIKERACLVDKGLIQNSSKQYPSQIFKDRLSHNSHDESDDYTVEKKSEPR